MSWSTSSCCACGCRAFERCARTASFDPMRAMPQWISETTQGPVCLPMSFVRYPLRRISETTQRLVIAPITHLIRGLSGHSRGVVTLILLPVSPLACRRCVATGKATYKLKYYNMEEIRAAAHLHSCGPFLFIFECFFNTIFCKQIVSVLRLMIVPVQFEAIM